MWYSRCAAPTEADPDALVRSRAEQCAKSGYVKTLSDRAGDAGQLRRGGADGHGVYRITMVGQAPDDNHLKLTIK
jgi:hypothetical protein